MVSLEKTVEVMREYTSERISKRAAPSLRSETVVTDLSRGNVEKKLKKASISLCCCKESVIAFEL